jgi:hypothetical protein
MNTKQINNMSAKLYRIGVLIICFVQFSSFSVTAQVVEPGTTQEHLKPLEYFVGTWKFSGMQFNRGVTGTMTFEWDLNKNILIRRTHAVPNDERDAAGTNMFVILWDAKNKRILERGYGGYGGYGQGEWTQTDQGWRNTGLGNWTLWNGKQTINKASYTVKNKNEFVLKATNQKEGEKEPFTTELTLTRVIAETEVEKEVKQHILDNNAYALKNLKDKAKTISKEGSLEFWSSGGLLHSIQQNSKVREFDAYNLHQKHIKVIEINATTAVALYYVEGDYQEKESENNTNYLTRAMLVYVKEEGGWKIRAAHWSPLTGGKGTTETAVQ